MKSPVLSVFCVLLAAMAGAAGQFLYHAGTHRASHGIASWVLNPFILLGILCYAAVMVFFLASFKAGGLPSVIYPLYASTFIWAAILGWVLHQQPIRPVHLAGMALLVTGMFLMGR